MKITIALLFFALPLLAQDSVKISMADIEKYIETAEHSINQVMSGKKQENVYFTQGQLNLLLQIREIGIQQNRTDTTRTDRGRNGKKK